MGWQDIVTRNKLQVSSVRLQKLNDEIRLDAEYYQPKALKYSESIQDKGFVPLSKVATFVVGPFGSTVTADKYVEDGKYSYIRNLDINKFTINEPAAHIPQDLFEKLQQFHVNENDLLVTVVGTLGKVGIARKKDTDSIFSCKSTIIRCTGINPYYLLTYLNSEIGQTLLIRCKRGAIQEGLNLVDIKTLTVPLPTPQIENAVNQLIIEAIDLFEKSEAGIKLAEKTLAENIGLDKEFSEQNGMSVRTLDVCATAGRFDSEYWQEYHDTIEDRIKNSPYGFDMLDKLFDISEETISPLPDENYGYIELADINSNNGTIKEPNVLTGSDLPSRAKMKIRENDLLLSSVEGSLDKVAVVNLTDGNLVGSTGFFVLRQAAFEPEVALILLRLKPIQLLLKRQAQGTILTAIPKTSLSRVFLPKINQEMQGTIKEMVSASHSQAAKAHGLLAKAKRLVEIYIEQDEGAAMRHLNK